MDKGTPPSAVSQATGLLEPLLLPGSINLLAGSSGAGKTALLALIARHLLSGAPLLGLPQRAPVGHLAYVGVDKSWTRSSSRWFAAEGLQALRHYCLPDDRHFKKSRMRTKTDRTTIFRECLLKVSPDGRSFPPHSVVLVEPIALFLGGNLLDYDTSAVGCLEVREVLHDLGDPVVLGTVHGGKIKSDKKQGYARLQDHILGSAALFGYTDTQFYLASPEELKSKTALLHVAPHHAPSFSVGLARDAEGRFVFTGAGALEGRPVPGPSWVVDVLAKTPDRVLSFGALLVEAIDRGISQSKLQRILRVEIDAGRVEHAGHSKYRAVVPS